ncbi:DUF459 domain-containing protein [uncultured Mailhella sp.]|uniref:SGNH/GDSL hydrolase family protein n=1 Tax=uncultured Mailhella sp. TaxID=1981031 RepID=UPI002628AB79|nr:DUF459 domain-containing protein [uncultured Mailhella sp.]
MQRYLFILLTFVMLCSCSREPAPPPSRTVMFAGDSIMVGLEPILQQALAGSGRRFVPLAKVATGFCRSDKFNWPSVLARNVEQERPEVVVICIGTNDGQALWDNGRFLPFNSPEWHSRYEGRLEAVISTVARYGGRTILLSPPVLRNPRLASSVAVVTGVIRDVCRRTGTPFLDIGPMLADAEGRFQRKGLDVHGQWATLRAQDGIHITGAGNELLATRIVPFIEQYL